MSENLFDNLVKLGNTNPELRDHIRPVLDEISGKEANFEKIAFSEEARQFVSWVFMVSQDSLSTKDMVRFFERNYDMEVQEPATKRPGSRFQKGDRVRVDASKHKDGDTLDIYQEFNNQVGTVVSSSDDDASLGEDVMVVLDKGSSAPVRFPRSNKSRNTGLVSNNVNEPKKDRGGSVLEMVYLSDKTRLPSPQQIAAVEAYTQKGKAKGEDRSSNYYTGLPSWMGLTKEDHVIVRISTPQRPYPVSINPNKGQILYLGTQGKRPSGWKKDYEKRVAEAAEKEGI